MILFRSRKVARLLREALAIEAARLRPEQVQDISEYIDYNEPGLALETLADMLDDIDLYPTAEAQVPMDAAAALLDVDYRSRLRDA